MRDKLDGTLMAVTAKENLDRAAIRKTFADLVGRSLHIDKALVTDEAYLDDLGAESLDLIQIVMEAEEAFGIWISEKSVLHTARQVYGPGVLDRDGVLTDEGKALLAARLPELDAAALSGEVPLARISKEFLRVGGWVAMIASLIEASPRDCPQCGGEFAKAAAYRRKCSACGVETPLPSGEELNRQWVDAYRARSAQAVAAAAAGD